MTMLSCPDERLADLLVLAADDEPGALAGLEALLGEFAEDPRLFFLKGSLLAGLERYSEGLEAMRRAVELDPGYGIARFQLGLLELSSGEAEAADATFQPLAESASESALSLFALGLRHLARDNFDEAEKLLRRGIEINEEHPLVSRDMQLMLERIAELRAGAALLDAPPAPDSETDPDSLSEAHLLLQRYSDKATRH